ncbi:MAG: class I SAM-dependent methyltransferase [Actinobacteria bacterium]|nr:class I SAM-dependent methyltransferase [Actinomycetota bacterium]
MNGATENDLPRDHYPALILTGERTLPGIREENYWFQRHLVAYRFLLPLAAGKRVLDLGSGEGYGTDLLASVALEAVGVDLAPEAVYHARRTYRRPNLRFLYGDIYETGLEEASFDLVCSLQVVEHLHRPERFMEEARRVLRPGGLCVITTPNRLIISPGRESPLNPFHIREYDYREFLAFMQSFYPRVEVKGIFHARLLRLHDLLLRRNFSQYCLELPPRRERFFYRPLFIPLLRTGDFKVREEGLEGALDFIGMGWKELPGDGGGHG